MLPKSSQSEKEHRRAKRQMEIKLVIDSIRQRLNAGKEYKILEFGTGDGFQIPYLKTLGKVVGSDIYTSEDLVGLQDFEFFQTSITDSSFGSFEFDVIFSNHVIEHIEALPKAFSELLRIGKDSCLYAFSVPTNIWLLMSVPGQYYNLAREVVQRIQGRKMDSKAASKRAQAALEGRPREKGRLIAKTVRALLPQGHGVERSFLRCYRSFRISSWQQLFVDNGFSILETKPLLLYGPSQWPIIPTTSSRGNLTSSVLFLLAKSAKIKSQIRPG
jgi:SAM-dependent methyltransferase